MSSYFVNIIALFRPKNSNVNTLFRPKKSNFMNEKGNKSVAMGRANNNGKVPRHRIISYSGEALVNERVLFFVKAIAFFFGFAFALGRDFLIDADRADQ